MICVTYNYGRGGRRERLGTVTGDRAVRRGDRLHLYREGVEVLTVHCSRVRRIQR